MRSPNGNGIFIKGVMKNDGDLTGERKGYRKGDYSCLSTQLLYNQSVLSK